LPAQRASTTRNIRLTGIVSGSGGLLATPGPWPQPGGASASGAYRYGPARWRQSAGGFPAWLRLPHLPAAGEVVIFDRSWYNRAGVERVMGFCSEEDAEKFLKMLPQVEQAIVESGIILLKYWLEVSEEEQTRRLEARIHDGRKVWKLSDMDLKSYGRWYDYSRARNAMFSASDSPIAPWFVANSNDKRSARLNIISDLLHKIPYAAMPRKKVTLPKRQKPDGYEEPDYPFKYIAEKF
jgi:polyphosphate kinase